MARSKQASATLRKEPGRYHHGQLDRALIEEALILTEELGLESWNFAELSRRLGVSSGAPYRHYKNKTELLDAIARHGLAQVRGLILAALEQHAQPREQLVAIVRQFVRLAQQRPTLYQLTFAGVRHDTLKKLAAADQTTAFGVLRKAVEGWLAAGFLVPRPANELAVLLWAHTHGLASLIATRRIELSERRALQMAEQHVDALLGGICAYG